MKYPKTINRYCPKCRAHTLHNVSIYKKGKDSNMSQGKRRFEKKKTGYGSFPKEIFHKNAKMNKRVTPLLECPECGKKHYSKSYRVKKFELQEV
ncbi:MAG: 50S ribosomal protein L44e [Promethearchaeota archaeon]